MIYGFAYLVMILLITFIWVYLAIFKKPDSLEIRRILLKNKFITFFNLKKIN